MQIWPVIPFNQIYAGPSKNGLTRPKRVRGDGYKMINMGELFAYDRIWNPPMELVPMNEPEIEKFAVKTGDLLFARQSLIASGAGKCSIVMNVPELTTFESHLIRVRIDQTKASPLFYYYYFLSPIGNGNVQSLVMQVAAAGIRGSELANLSVPYPPLPTQQKIAAILSAYDDLIENNVRRIAILEEMAQSLYREWFVHFRFPGHEKNGMVESALGLIPEGWEVVKFTDIADVLGGGTPKTTNSEYWNGSIPFFTPKDSQTSFYVIETEKSLTEVGLKNCSSRLYPKNTVFITARGTVGKVVLNSVDMAMNQSCYALQGRDGFDQYLVFLCIRSCIDQLKQNAHGAVFDTIITDTFRMLRVVKPPLALINTFYSIVSPLFEATLNLLQINANLRKTQDLLLPKMIGGEVDVEGVEIVVGEMGNMVHT